MYDLINHPLLISSICFILMPHYLFTPITQQLGFIVIKQCQEY